MVSMHCTHCKKCIVNFINSLDGSEMTEFSELEMEILTKLPDTPTANHAREYLAGVGKNTTSYRDWVSIACRHTVLALNKAPSCPSLTRPQTSLQAHNLYCEMLPLLRASNMTLSDLDIDLTGEFRGAPLLLWRGLTVNSLSQERMDGACLRQPLSLE